MSDTTPIPPASERDLLPCPFCGHDSPEFERMGTSSQSCIVICGNCGARHESGDEYLRSGSSWNTRAALSHPSTPQGWQPISTSPEGELVVVGWLDDEDTEHPERHDFDWLEDGLWQKHSADHEHFLMVAPPGSRGPSEKAPYTHWQRIGAIPAPPEQGGKG